MTDIIDKSACAVKVTSAGADAMVVAGATGAAGTAARAATCTGGGTVATVDTALAL